MKIRIILGAVLAAVVIAVLFLTFQGPQETFSLSESVRSWFLKLGYKRGPLEFRSDFHLVEYFVIGLVLAIFGKASKWKMWIPGVIGCVFGLIDETIKIFLPTREFSGIDLIKDFIGVWVAVILIYGITLLKNHKEKDELG